MAIIRYRSRAPGTGGEILSIQIPLWGPLSQRENWRSLFRCTTEDCRGPRPQAWYLAKGIFSPLRFTSMPRVLATRGGGVVSFQVHNFGYPDSMILRKADQFASALAARGVPVLVGTGRGDIRSARARTKRSLMKAPRPVRANRTWRMPTRSSFGFRGFGQAEEVVVEVTERSVWPGVIAAGSVGIIVLGMVYAMGKETIGRAY